MLRGIIISDTHLENFKALGEKLSQLICGADFVIHAGDFDTIEFITELKKNSKELYAVKGNCDYGTPFPLELFFTINGVSIGLCHGAGRRDNIIDRLAYTFHDRAPEIIIFGHTHAPFIGKIGDTTFINPGSLFSNRTVPYGTFCEIIIEENRFDAKILRMDNI